MRKYKTWILTAFFLLCCIGTGLYYYYFIWLDDVTAPVITMEEQTLQVSVFAEDADLLAGVSAQDERDGDVSKSLVVESVANINEENQVTVTYAAFDSAGNVTKAKRMVTYADYKAPVFGLRDALVFQEDMASDILRYVSARDMVDGDISGNVKGTLVSDTRTLSYAGLHQVEFRVTNTLGDTARLTLPVDVYPAGSYNAAVGLTDYLLYLKKGADFYPEQYLKSFTAGAKTYRFLDEEGNWADGITAGGSRWDGKTDGNINGEAGGREENAEEENTGEENGADAWDRFGISQEEPEMILNFNRALDITEEMEDEFKVFHIDMEHNVKTEVPGLYSVTYTLMLDERYMGYTRMNVIVEE